MYAGNVTSGGPEQGWLNVKPAGVQRAGVRQCKCLPMQEIVLSLFDF